MRKKSIVRNLLLLSGAIVSAVILACAVLVWNGLHDDIHHADVALVLGNKIEADGTPSARLRARLDKTVELYRDGLFPAVIVSGGIGREGFDEAAVMRDYLVSQGIPREQIYTDNEGVTTYATARNSLRILREEKMHSVLVVTQYFHVPRTKLVLRRFGISPVYSAHARFFEWRDFYSIPRELAGCVSYTFRYYSFPVWVKQKDAG